MSTYRDKDTAARDNEYGNAKTYVFNFEEDASMAIFTSETRSKIWQIFPSLCACLFCLVFGIMLGWPSPIYPKLLPKTSPIPISLDQSAMIAGLLMAGNILGVPLSSFSPIGTKYGILLSLLCMVCGWILMWQARNLFCLLGSRCLIGFGNGYGLGQVKQYIKDLCEQDLAEMLKKSINLFTIFGILLAFCIGPYVDFRLFSVIGACIAIVCFTVCVFLPHSPVELVKFGKIKQAKKLMFYLKPNLNADIETEKIKTSLESGSAQVSIWQVMKSKILMRNLVLVLFLVFFQQFSGPPATIVYCQILFKKLGAPCPEIFAIVYIIIFFFSNVLGYYHMERYNKKYCLLFSSFAILLLLIINVILIYFNVNEKCCYSSIAVMYLFIFFHTIGLGCVPFNITEKLFPKPCLKAVAHSQFIIYCFFAIIVTKLFQVLFTNYDFYVPFIMFSCVAVLSTFFILIFVPYTISVLNVDVPEKT